ncbi:hypothetical protein G9A89_010301 [Geosiphon pyriformis]|nr:hypothetical protein G9A89_010301 [Geosiphon pyriformis]
MDESLSSLETLDIKAGVAVFFENIDLGLGVEVSGLVFSTITELQAVALALKCISFSSLVQIFSNNQSALNACKSELDLLCPNFQNQCWVKCYHIVGVIHKKSLEVSWHKVKSHLGILGNKHIDVFAKAACSSNWYLSYHITKYYIRAGGGIVSANSRHFVYNVFQSVYQTY